MITMTTTQSSQDPVQTPLHIATPLVDSPILSDVLSKATYPTNMNSDSVQVLLKLECLQPSGSFKMRGIGFMCSKAHSQNGVKHFIASSGGNAGAAVAQAGRKLGVPVTIVVPTTTPLFMINRLKTMGALVKVHGSVWNESDILARELAKEEGSAYIPPFDHEDIWEGHATMIDEISQNLALSSATLYTAPVKPSAVILSVGGGGLLLGVCHGMERCGWNDVPIIAAETEGADCLSLSLAKGDIVTLPGIHSIAKSLGSTRVVPACLEWAKRRPIISCVVTDREAVEACYAFSIDHRQLVEPACGAALAVAYKQKEALLSILDGGQSTPSDRGNSKKVGPVVVIVCGGNMVTPALLTSYCEKTFAQVTDASWA